MKAYENGQGKRQPFEIFFKTDELYIDDASDIALLNGENHESPSYFYQKLFVNKDCRIMFESSCSFHSVLFLNLHRELNIYLSSLSIQS
jgi:hypothetical protein